MAAIVSSIPGRLLARLCWRLERLLDHSLFGLQDMFNLRQKLVKHDGFSAKVMRSRCDESTGTVRLKVARHSDDARSRPARANLLKESKSVHARHNNIGKHQIKRALVEFFQR